MNASNTRSRQGHRLLQIGVALLLFSSFEGFAIPHLAAPLLGLSGSTLRALEGGDDATRLLDDRDQRHDVIGFQAWIGDDVHASRRDHRKGVAVRAVAGELHLLLELVVAAARLARE